MDQQRADYPRYRANNRSPNLNVYAWQPHRGTHWVIALSTVAAFVFALLLTGEGMRLSPDSHEYMATARLISQIGGIPITYSWWPPLYPLTLTPFTDMQMAARSMNAVCLALTVTLTLYALRDRTTGLLVGIVATLVLSPSLQFVHRYVWSEPLFVTLVAAWFALLLAGVKERRRVVLLALIAALLGLQRYVGILFVPFGVFALLLNQVNWKRIAVYVLIAGVPLGLWMLRNILLGYPATGADRGAAYFTFAYGTQTAILTLIGWLPVLALAFGAGFVGRSRLPRSFLLVCAYYVVVHIVFIIWSQSTTGMDSADDRLLAPVFVPLVYGVTAVGGMLGRQISTAPRRLKSPLA